MSNEEDRLADFDLSAWEVPPPAADLADAVIDRMAGTAVNVAGAVEPASQPRRAWLVGGVVAAALVLAAAGVWSLVGGTRPAVLATGSVVAERARTLSLDIVRASLDPGADVRWHREGAALHVEQRAGTVAWQVEKNETLVITAGAGLATVEATGANLRVEVQMNAMDVRVIGASAVTAAAVAMVTVVVYEGHVNVGRGDRPAVLVAAGSTYQVKAEEAPVVGGTTEATVATCDAEALKDQGMEHINLGQHAEALEQLELSLACKDDPYVVQLALMEACASGNLPKAKLYYNQLTPAQQQKLAQICIGSKVAYLEEQDDAADENCDEVSCVLTDYEGACCTKYRDPAPKPTALDRAAISKGIGTIEVEVDRCRLVATRGGKVVARVRVRPAGDVAKVEAAGDDAALADCVEAAVAKATFVPTTDGGVFSYPFVFPEPETTCDADQLKEQAMGLINTGQHSAALAKLEASLACKRDPYVVQLAFMEACSSNNSARAKHYYKQLPPAQQKKFAMICDRQNVAYE